MLSWQAYLLKVIFRLRRTINPPTGALDVDKARQELETLTAKFKTKIKYSSTRVNLNHVPAEWITPQGLTTNNVILYFHGGGYYSGSISTHRDFVANIAAAAKAKVLLIGYRLAPEHLFPAAVEDAVSAYRWLLTNGHSPGHIIIAGDSCGGGLLIALLLSLRDAQEPLPSVGVCLSPWMDLSISGESYVTNAKKDLMLDSQSSRVSARLYLGETDPKNPLASPLFADLQGLPPILIQVGSAEILLSDATIFAERAQAAGTDVTLEIWDGMQHEWHFAVRFMPEARQAVDRIGEYIQDKVPGVPV